MGHARKPQAGTTGFSKSTPPPPPTTTTPTSSEMRVAVAVLAALAVVASATLLPEEFVDTLGGTHSRFSLSHGNILPEVAVPWCVHN